MTTELKNNLPASEVETEINADDQLLTVAQYPVIWEIQKSVGEFKSPNDNKVWHGYKAYLHDPNKRHPSDSVIYLPEKTDLGYYSVSSRVYVGQGKRNGKDVTGKLLFGRSFDQIKDSDLIFSKIGLATRKNSPAIPKDAMIADYPVLIEFASLEKMDLSGSVMYRYETYLHDPQEKYPTSVTLYNKEQITLGYSAFSSEVFLNRSKKIDFRPIFHPIEEKALLVSKFGVAIYKPGAR